MAEINFPLSVRDENSGGTYHGTGDRWPQNMDTLPKTSQLKLQEESAGLQVEKIKKDCCEFCPFRAKCPGVRVGTGGMFSGAWVKVVTRTSLTKTEFLTANPACAQKYGATFS